MKNKTTLFLLILALSATVLSFNYGLVFAQQQQGVMGKAGAPAIEFSNLPDKQAEQGAGGFWGLGGLDSLQVVYTESNDAIGPAYPSNSAYDFGTSGEIDALANGGDLYLYETIKDTSTLIISFQGDPGGNAVWYEIPTGSTGVKWTQLSLVNEVAGHRIDDLDALEVWGPLGSDDADFYSEKGDPASTGDTVRVSVKSMSGGNYIYRWRIFSACSTLGYTGSPSLIDLDGLMVLESKGILGDKIWNSGDRILFSIRNTIPGGGNWDGGEIVVLPFGVTPSFLHHGGHDWNTAFNIGTAFGVPTEEVDAIEALSYDPPHDPPIPALTEWGIIILVVLLTASTVFIMLRKRKATMPA